MDTPKGAQRCSAQIEICPSIRDGFNKTQKISIIARIPEIIEQFFSASPCLDVRPTLEVNTCLRQWIPQQLCL